MLRSRRSASSAGRAAVRSSDVGDPGHRDHGARPRRVDVHPQPLPRRDQPQPLGGGLHPQPRSRPGPGRALAVPVDQHPEAGERLLTGHLLLDDRGHQRLHHQPGATQPRVRVPAQGLGEHRVPGLEPGPVVAGAEQVGQRCRGPSRRRGPRPVACTSPEPGRASTSRVATPAGVRVPRQARPAPSRANVGSEPPRRCWARIPIAGQGQEGRHTRTRSCSMAGNGSPGARATRVSAAPVRMGTWTSPPRRCCSPRSSPPPRRWRAPGRAAPR